MTVGVDVSQGGLARLYTRRIIAVFVPPQRLKGLTSRRLALDMFVIDRDTSLSNF